MENSVDFLSYLLAILALAALTSWLAFSYSNRKLALIERRIFITIDESPNLATLTHLYRVGESLYVFEKELTRLVSIQCNVLPEVRMLLPGDLLVVARTGHVYRILNRHTFELVEKDVCVESRLQYDNSEGIFKFLFQSTWSEVMYMPPIQELNRALNNSNTQLQRQAA